MTFIAQSPVNSKSIQKHIARSPQNDQKLENCFTAHYSDSVSIGDSIPNQTISKNISPNVMTNVKKCIYQNKSALSHLGSVLRNDVISSFGLKNDTYGIILMYHRIFQPEHDSWALCVSPENFVEHLSVIHELGHPISLEELIYGQKKRKLPNRSIVITFDDGYADNYYLAKPLLERKGIPAIFYITTGSIDSDKEFWWDTLEKIFLTPSVLPENLGLTIGKIKRKWELGEASQYTERDFFCNTRWYAGDENVPSFRHKLFKELHTLLVPLSEDERDKILDDLINWSGNKLSMRSSYRALSEEEIIDFENDLLKIGAHTMNHLDLSQHSVNKQKNEIINSKIVLEKLLKHTVTHFSYPFGRFATTTPSLLKENHFVSAVTTCGGVVNHLSDMYRLPRIEVRNWGRAEFTERLMTALQIN
jgi:peptidoglycan/xylan/chitin deacetylase (PgdA/CDA1 family)